MKLSIIIPTYNVEKFIKKTIKSLIVQVHVHEQFEIIIVDDGSTDNTLKVVDEIIKENNLTNCLVKTKANGGVSSARNEGIRAASGKYIMFLDGDDYVSTNLIESIYKNINNSTSDIICWGCNIVDENKVTIKNYFDVFKLKHESMTGIEALNNIINYKTMWIYTGSAAYRSELLTLNNIEYIEGCANGEDQEFTIKALSRAKKVNFIAEGLVYYVQRGTSISNSYNIQRFDVMDAMERTYKYVENIGNSELDLICEKLKNEHIVDTYIYNFDCCLDYVYKNGTVDKESFKTLFNDIQGEYPRLNTQLISSMKNYSGNDIKIIFKVKMFIISPLLYNWIFNLKKKMKRVI